MHSKYLNNENLTNYYSVVETDLFFFVWLSSIFSCTSQTIQGDDNTTTTFLACIVAHASMESGGTPAHHCNAAAGHSCNSFCWHGSVVGGLRRFARWSNLRRTGMLWIMILSAFHAKLSRDASKGYLLGLAQKLLFLAWCQATTR